MLLTSVISALALPLLALANPHGSGAHARHAELAKRAAGHVDIHKRFSGTRWTFYDVGLGACGKYNSRNDFIVALNSAQYGGGYPGPNCFKQISMTYNGKTTTATIMDQCPGCPFGGLDLSRGLFEFFAAESVGVIYGSWNFIGGGGGGGDDDQPKPKPPPKTTWKPTTTWKPPKPTTTWKPEPEPTTTTHKTTSTPKPTTSDDPTTSSTSTKTTSSSAPAIAPTPSSVNNLNVLGSVLINLGGIAVAGAAGNNA